MNGRTNERTDGRTGGHRTTDRQKDWLGRESKQRGQERKTHRGQFSADLVVSNQPLIFHANLAGLRQFARVTKVSCTIGFRRSRSRSWWWWWRWWKRWRWSLKSWLVREEEESHLFILKRYGQRC